MNERPKVGQQWYVGTSGQLCDVLAVKNASNIVVGRYEKRKGTFDIYDEYVTSVVCLDDFIARRQDSLFLRSVRFLVKSMVLAGLFGAVAAAVLWLHQMAIVHGFIAT
jgi:hypothetical protein